MWRTRVSISLVVVATLSLLTMMAGCSSDTKYSQAQAAGSLELIESPEEALDLLKEGNNRFVQERYADKDLGSERRTELLSGQHPFAVIVSCSDSRVPPEYVFDQGQGDIFVVRVAGNVIDEVNLGSVEYAVEHLGVKLVVVLGHQKCGAVTACVEGGEAPGSISAIVDRITPSVVKARQDHPPDAEHLVEAATKENVKASLAALEESPILKEKLEKKELIITGAEYQIGSGEVEWLNT